MKKRRVFPGPRALLLMISIASLHLSCTNKNDSGTVRVLMPSNFTAAATKTKISAPVSSNALSALSEDDDLWNSDIIPTAGSEINCFGVFVGATDLADNYCSVGSTDAEANTIRFGPNVGFRKPGETIELIVAPGKRTIYVVGLKASDASHCTDNYGEGHRSNLSQPFLIATQPLSVVSGANPPVRVVAALDTNKKILDCKIAGRNGPSGGIGSKPFGDKREGGIVPDAGGTMIAGTATLVSGTMRTGTSTLPNTRIFGASRRITSIATAGTDAGRSLGIQDGYTADEFSPGDEVAWYVLGGSSSGASPDDPISGACGGGFHIGRFGTARILSTPSATTMVLDRQISLLPATIRTANLTASPTTANFCTIVLARVSSFDSINIPDGSNLTMYAQGFSYANGKGGVLVVRAETVSIGTGSTFALIASAKGFAGGTAAGSIFQGEGLNAASSTTPNSNYNGGAPGNASIGGGGGANAGVGASGSGLSATTGLGGSALNHCMGPSPCRPFADEKVFMGGGGGAAGSGSGAAGGAGGGIVILFARTITGNGTLSISSNGANGSTFSTLGAGGGGGGVVGLYTKTSSVATVFLEAKGGNGGANSTAGGGGGGGVVNVRRCASSFVSALTTTATGGTGGSSVAGVGLTSTEDRSEICLIP